MTTHTIKGYITWREAPSWAVDRGPEIDFLTYDPRTIEVSSRPRVVVAEHTIEVEVPDDFDPRPEQIARLKAQKAELRAKFSAAVQELDDRINSLLALEMSE